MVDWVHCNICFIQVGQQKKFAISNCGHIHCRNCILKAQNQCRICKKQVAFEELSSRMSAQYEIYFISPMELAQRHLSELKKVTDFQNKNRLQLLNHIKQKTVATNNVSDEYNKLKQRLRKMESDIQELEVKYRATVNENSHLKQLVESNKFSDHNTVSAGASKTPCTSSSFVLNTPSSQTPPKNEKLISSYKNDKNPAQISPSRISAITSPVDGRIGITPSRINMNNPSSTLRSIPISTPRYSFPSMVTSPSYSKVPSPSYSKATSPSYQIAPSPMELSASSQFSRFGTSSCGRLITPRRLITADMLKKI